MTILVCIKQKFLQLMLSEQSLQKMEEVYKKLSAEKLKISVAESCSGGLLAALLTELPGSSKFFDRGFVAYSNKAKIDLLGVKEETLQRHGAVSAQIATEMAQGALKNSLSDLALAITGIAGPSSDATKKPIGLVFIAFSSHKKSEVREFYFTGDRSEIRQQAVLMALALILEMLL
jgi:PncC family amidohydrolase